MIRFLCNKLSEFISKCIEFLAEDEVAYLMKQARADEEKREKIYVNEVYVSRHKIHADITYFPGTKDEQQVIDKVTIL